MRAPRGVRAALGAPIVAPALTSWDMPLTPPPTGYREIQRQELARLFGQLVVFVQLLVEFAKGLEKGDYAHW